MSDYENIDSWGKCPKCYSSNTRCWDTRTHWYRDDTGDFELPVGYMVCDDCSHHWLDEDVASFGAIDVSDEYEDN